MVITTCTPLVTLMPTINTTATARNHTLATAALSTTLLASAGLTKSRVEVASGRLPVTMNTIEATSSAQPEKKPISRPNRWWSTRRQRPR